MRREYLEGQMGSYLSNFHIPRVTNLIPDSPGLEGTLHGFIIARNPCHVDVAEPQIRGGCMFHGSKPSKNCERIGFEGVTKCSLNLVQLIKAHC